MSPLPHRLKILAGTARLLLWLVLGVWLLLLLGWAALHLWIVPRIGEWRPQLERAATQTLGLPVRIGSIAAEVHGLFSSFELQQVVLLDPQGRSALTLPQVRVAVSPRSLWQLGFEQLVIDRPELELRRSLDGRWFIAGLELSRPTAAADPNLAEWFFRQTEWVIRGGRVYWHDAQRAADPVVMQNVDFVARNRGRAHDLRLDATPPADWGERFTLRARLRQPLLSGHNGRWQEWDGQLFADFARVDVAQLRRSVDLGVQVEQGIGALRVWADVVQGSVSAATADLALAQVNATLAAGREPLLMHTLSGRLGGRRLAGGFEFFTQDLRFETADGLHWPGGNVFFSSVAGEGRIAGRGELRADRLDLLALGRIAERLPLQPELLATLSATAPRGLVERLELKWQGRWGSLSSYQASGRVSQLALLAQAAKEGAAGTPGLSGADIDFELTQAGGKAQLLIQHGSLDLPEVFEERLLPLKHLSSQLQWQVSGEQWQLQANQLKFANADLQGEAQLHWRTADPARAPARARFPGVLDLQGSISQGNGARVYRYLPLGVHQDARNYVRAAVLAGDISALKFKVKGDLLDFPFTDPARGDFHIGLRVSKAVLAYVPRALQPAGEPAWPALTNLAGELVFERNQMQVREASAGVQELPALQLTQAEVRIANLLATTVEVTAQVRGPLRQQLALVASSPLAQLTGHALDQASASGNAEIRLRLTLPIAQIERSRVQGSLLLAGNDLQVMPATPQLGRVRGQLNFSETGFTLAGVQARLFGGEARLEGGWRKLNAAGAASESPLTLHAQGQLSAEGLRQASELGYVARLAQHASGSTTYQAQLGLRQGVPELRVNSNLQGLTLNLPAPLNKAADSSLPLRYESTLLPGAPAGRLHEQLVLSLGRALSVQFQRELGAAEPRVLRGAIGVGLDVGESAPLPESGVVANVNLPLLDVDAWEKLLVGAVAGTAREVPAAAGTPAWQAYLPSVLALRARELVQGGYRLSHVVAGGSQEDRTWRLNLDASELSGYLEYRQGLGNAAGRLYARLAYLRLSPAGASQAEALLSEPPQSIPALDVVIEDFELRGKKLGRAEIEAVNRSSSAREWRLNTFNLSTPEATLSASGNWAAVGGGALPAAARRSELRRTALKFRLELIDSGLLLARFGMPDVIRRGKGRIEGQLAWAGSPLQIDYPTLAGQFNVGVEAGQFLKADPGLAKLLGVLSLQALPRRLALDFSDVFSQGFSFDFVRGDVQVEQGIAFTNNLQMKGVNAAALMEGRADIARETQDLKVVVVPEINAGTASLVATIINPAVGLGTFLAQMLLRRPLSESATQEFHIDGSWTDPRVTRVPHTAPTPGPGSPAVNNKGSP